MLLHRNAFGPPGLRWAVGAAAMAALGLLIIGSLRWPRVLSVAAVLGLVASICGTAVSAVGGWNNEPVPTLADFVAEVRARRISYYVENGRGHGLARYGREIAEWVARNYPPTVVGDTKAYRLM